MSFSGRALIYGPKPVKTKSKHYVWICSMATITCRFLRDSVGPRLYAKHSKEDTEIQTRFVFNTRNETLTATKVLF